MKSCIRIRTAAAAIAGAALCVTAPAWADGAYAGGSLGVPSFPNGVNGVTGSGTGLSGKVFGGYQIGNNLAFEAGLAELGRTKDNGSGTAHGHGEYLDAIGLLPISQGVSLLGSLGVAHVNLNTSNGDNAGTALKLGLGAEFALAPNLALRTEWERYGTHHVPGNPNVDQYTVGLRVSF